MEIIPPENLVEVSDKALYKLCLACGRHSREWLRKFAFMLPEVARRRLHRRYGFSSVHEFAAKLCGMSISNAEEVLRLSVKFSSYPSLWRCVLTQGWSKLRVIASALELEPEAFWLEKVETLSKLALESFVRELREQQLVDRTSSSSVEFPGKAVFPIVLPSCKPKCVGGESFGENCPRPKVSMLRINVSLKTATLFRKFKRRLEKERRESVAAGEALAELLKNQELQVFAPEVVKGTNTRAPSKSQKQNLEAKYQNLCAFPGCTRLYEHFHHPERWSLKKSHEKLVPLCKAHHELAHAGLIANEEYPPEEWQLQKSPDRSGAKFRVDQKFQQKRREYG